MRAHRWNEKGLVLCAIAALCLPASGLRAQPELIAFGGSNYYPPFHYQGASGTATGFDVEVLRAAVAEGAELSFDFGDWTQIQERLATGDLDVAPMFVSPEREAIYLFSDPINIEYHLLFGRADAPSHRSLGTIGGYRVAMERGAYAREQLRSLAPDAQIVEADNEAQALRLVASGGADLALLPATIARHTLEQERLEGLQAVSPLLLPVTYAFAVTPTRPALVEQLNEGILGLQRSGELQRLRERWLEPGANPPRDRLFWALAAVAWLSAGLALWLWWRRRQGLQEFFDADSRLLLDELRKAISERRLAWVYQPQYDVRTQRIVGAEMLARWHHPQRGAIAPDTFIQLAERAGIVKDITLQISLDDYGTGYSSLESLKRFAFDEIKIDKTFIDGIVQSERNLKLTQASISLGHDLGALVVAEGVEDEDTVALLVQKGCDVLQGYCICRPMPADEFVNFSEDFNRQSSQSVAG